MQALEIARPDGSEVMDVLQSREFTTALGSVRFDAKGDRTDNPYRLFRYDGTKFVEAHE